MKAAIIIVLVFAFQNVIFSQEFKWANSFGEHTTDNSISTTVDETGNSYITGFATANTMLGDYQIQNWGMYVAKFDPTGEFIWAMESDGASSTQPTCIVCDNFNNVIITGYYSHNISFGDIELPFAIQARMFLVKYDSVGNLLWAKSFGSINLVDRTYTNSITVDNNRHIYATGAFNHIAVFDDITLESKNSENFNRFDIFLAKFDEGGNTIWAKRAGGDSDDYAYSNTFDKSNNIYVSGVFRPKQADFGSINLDYENIRPRDFIAKYDTAGNTIWVKHGDVGEDGFSELTSIKTDNNGNVCAFGNFYEPLIYEDDTLSKGRNFFLKLDKDGNKIFIEPLNTGNWYGLEVDGTWTRKLGEVAIDQNNNLFISAKFSDTLVVGNDTLLSYLNQYGNGSADILVAKYNEIGYPQWAVKAGGTLNDYAKSIVCDSSIIYISGYYASSEATFGDHVISNNSGNSDEDIYHAKIIDTTANQCPIINPTLISSHDYICDGDSVLISCESNFGSSFLWVINDSVYSFQYSSNYWANDSLKVYVIVNPNTNCSDTSNTIYLEKRPLPIAEIIISSDLILCPDSTINLITHLDSSYEYSWFRNDQLIASGTNSINVSMGGNYSVEVLKNDCQNSDIIQVLSKEIPIIELPLDTLTTYTFPVFFNAGQSDDQYLWKHEDDTSTLSYESIVEFTQEGMHYVFLSNECGIDNDSLFVYNPVSNINENGDCINDLIIFPNPAKTEISVFSKCIINNYEISVCNQLGQKVLEKIKNPGKIDISTLEQGLYIIELSSDEYKLREKLIIKK